MTNTVAAFREAQRNAPAEPLLQHRALLMLAQADAETRYTEALGRGAILSAEVEDITLLCLRQETARIDAVLAAPKAGA